MIRTGDREIHPLFGRLPDNLGELAYIYICDLDITHNRKVTTLAV